MKQKMAAYDGKTNILLVGLIYDSNLGDRAIYECTLKTVRDFIDGCNKSVRIRALDLYGRSGFENYAFKRSFMNKVIQKTHNILFGEKPERELVCRAVSRRFDKLVDDYTQAVIFVGGGLIKYAHQVISEPMRCVLEKANARKIPVMLSAVGVEGYSENSEECQALKKALNRDCVKIITTRDDYSLLKDKYIVNSMIRTAKVSDPACQISKIYPSLPPKSKNGKVIGLGIGRFGLFSDYGRLSDKETMISLWKNVCSELIMRGYRCVLFTNGLGADYDAAKELSEMLRSKEILLAERPKNLSELTGIISGFDGVIATRLHSGIIAYSYGIPTVGLVWNDKQTMFGEVIGRPERFVKEPFDAGVIVRRLETAMSEGSITDDDYCAAAEKWINVFLKECI